jgi:hypothetical protein
MRRAIAAIVVILLCVLAIAASAVEERRAGEDARASRRDAPIPKRVMQTYSDATKVPAKVYANIAKYAPGFEHAILDDADAVRFLAAHYDESVVRGFEALAVGAHKADLLRYCLLYVHGGVYLDIKTELIVPLSDVFYGTGADLYVVLQHDARGIYNGVIAAKPRNALFLELIRGILRAALRVPREPIAYHAFVAHFLEVLRAGLHEPLVCGAPLRSVWGTVFVLREGCTQRSEDCYDGLDRYGLCCFIRDSGRPVIKVRYADYPFNNGVHTK